MLSFTFLIHVDTDSDGTTVMFRWGRSFIFNWRLVAVKKDAVLGSSVTKGTMSAAKIRTFRHVRVPPTTDVLVIGRNHRGSYVCFVEERVSWIVHSKLGFMSSDGSKGLQSAELYSQTPVTSSLWRSRLDASTLLFGSVLDCFVFLFDSMQRALWF